MRKTTDTTELDELNPGELNLEELGKVSGGGIYMKYEDIKGDVTSNGHENWIELRSL